MVTGQIMCEIMIILKTISFFYSKIIIFKDCISFLLCRGSAVAKIIGNNVKTLQKFASTVNMWVFEENINGRKLTDIINNDHENVKYLPGCKLPDNVVRLRSCIIVMEQREYCLCCKWS